MSFLIPFVFFCTGNDSQVNIDSWISKLISSSNLASAGILSQVSINIISQIVKPQASIICSTQSLNTFVFSQAIFFKDWIALSALYSCINQKIAFKITTAKIIAASVTSHMEAEIQVATSKTTTNAD
jgi:hypothetical protein